MTDLEIRDDIPSGLHAIATRSHSRLHPPKNGLMNLRWPALDQEALRADNIQQALQDGHCLLHFVNPSLDQGSTKAMQ